MEAKCLEEEMDLNLPLSRVKKSQFFHAKVIPVTGEFCVDCAGKPRESLTSWRGNTCFFLACSSPVHERKKKNMKK